ncbi:S-layer homology domain-containing protein [Paenibacillus cineris]|uniref:S-layer homology domain-containing protein n=1 Tax=Paenibacillus cineris TaxID=237530 RepID=UPI001B2F2196|nr:S-layer homology domain-containing protein [Paenibacillus cineris]GIO61457.1 hypothetical protein J43TS9_30310 [Paenibacillus cineris]
MKRLSYSLTWLIILIFIGSSIMPAPSVRADSDAVPPEADGWVQVSTPEQLMYIDQNQELYLSKNISLLNDVDVSGLNWIPLGQNEQTGFSGTFDGNGHLITGVHVIDHAYDNVGTFGFVSGTIQNLGVSVDVEGGVNTGGLVGMLSGGSIIRSYSLGSVKGKVNAGSVSVTGGLAGCILNATMANSYSAASVLSGSASNIYVGGLVGSAGVGTIANSFARGPVANLTYGNNYFVFSSALVSHSVNTKIENTYATGHVDDSNHPGTDYVYFSGLVGFLWDTASVNNSYFDTLTTGTSAGVFSGNASGVHGMTSDQMKIQTTYEGWDFNATWAMDPGINDGYPYLRPAILTTALPEGLTGTPYSLNLSAFDGAGRGLTWDASGLPDGITLDPAGKLEGTPAQSGDFDVSFTVTDAAGISASATLPVTIGEGDSSAPDLTAFNIGPGSAAGSTKVTAEPRLPGDSFAYAIGNAAAVQPLVGDPLPEDATLYTLGSDISNVHAGQYLTVYEVNDQQLIQAWHTLPLEDRHIRAAVPVTGVKLDLAALTLRVGQAPQKMTAVIEPENAANTGVTWSSSDFGVAVVTASGEVTPVAEGTATITVTTQDGSFQARAVVTVLPASQPPVQGGGSGGYGGAAPSSAPAPAAPAPTMAVTANGKVLHMKWAKETVNGGESVTHLFADPDQVRSMFSSNPKAVIVVDNTDPVVKLDLPAAAVQVVLGGQPNAMLQLQVNGASDTLPLSLWKDTAGKSVITLSITKASNSTSQEMSTALSQQGIRLIGAPVEFSAAVDGQEVTIPAEYNGERTLRLDSAFDPDSSTVVWMDTKLGPQFVPSLFETVEQTTQTTEAAFHGPNNRMYAVVESKPTFTDIQGHWAQTDIEKLAGKLIVQGIRPGTFAPDYEVTRAQFTAMLVRAFGLNYALGGLPFSDVADDAWYAGSVHAALQAGLINGYDNQNFKPAAPISREQMAAMIARAIGYAGQLPQPDEFASGIQGYTDLGDLAGWAKEPVSQLLKMNVLRGNPGTSFRPEAGATRAECAVVLKRMLEYLGYINK